MTRSVTPWTRCRSAIWALYAELKPYKAKPNAANKIELEARFDALRATKTCFESLNSAPKNAHLRGVLTILGRILGTSL